MDNQDEALHGLENEYMDDLIRLAVKRERMQEAEEILRLSREPVTPEEDIRLDRIWSQAEARMDEINARKKKEGRNQKIRSINSFLSQAAKIAACLVLIAAVGTTVAMARSSAFRSAVFRLFATENAEDNTVSWSFRKDESAAFDVPAAWTGDYFLRIPEGFEMTDDPADYEAYPYVGYTSGDKVIYFEELSVEADGISDSEEKVNPIVIRGDEGYINEVSASDCVELHWRRDDKWLSLTTYGMTREEAIALAESVERVHPDEQ